MGGNDGSIDFIRMAEDVINSCQEKLGYSSEVSLGLEPEPEFDFCPSEFEPLTSKEIEACIRREKEIGSYLNDRFGLDRQNSKVLIHCTLKGDMDFSDWYETWYEAGQHRRFILYDYYFDLIVIKYTHSLNEAKELKRHPEASRRSKTVRCHLSATNEEAYSYLVKECKNKWFRELIK